MLFTRFYRFAYRLFVGIYRSLFGVGRVDGFCLILTGLLFFGGCDACGGDSTVPFKRKTSSAEEKKKTADESPPSIDPSDETQAALTRTFVDETREIVVGDAPLEIGEGSIRAMLGFDLDSDGDQDALLIATNVEEHLVLLKAERTTEGFETPEVVSTLWSLIPNCQVTASTIQNLGSSYAEISATFSCNASQKQLNAIVGETSEEEPPKFSPGPTAEPIREPSERESWIVTLEPVPRLFERIALLPDGENRAPDKIAFQLTSRDLDNDGHDDIEMAIEVTNPNGGEKNALSMSWLNRPSGLARDRSQPEGLLLSVADRARNALKKDPDAALKRTERIQQIYDALCRQGGVSKLLINGVAGFDCAASNALGRARAVRVAALAKKQNITQALETYRALDSSSLKVSAKDRKLADEAIQSIPSVANVVWQQGPEHRGSSGPEVRLSSIAFIDENTLLLRGAQPRYYHIDDQSFSDAAPGAGRVLVEDNSQRFAVAAIVRSCLGYHIRIVTASQAEAGITTAPAVSEPLIERQPVRPGTPCSNAPEEIENGFNGYRVLGWTPQGIVVAKDSTLLLIAVDDKAQPVRETVAVRDAKALYALLSPGASTPNGHLYAVITHIGILLQKVLPSPKTLLIRPPLWRAQEAGDVAVSPSGRKVAYLASGRVYLGRW